MPLSAVQQQLEDITKEAEALVLFMQDEFSHFDFSRFRGLDGASFKQLEVCEFCIAVLTVTRCIVPIKLSPFRTNQGIPVNAVV